MENLQTLSVFIIGFFVVALASKQIGEYFTRINFPLISGFLFAGILAGPFVLDLIHHEAIEKLRIVDEVSLAFIAFAAGSELYLKELHSRFKSITWVTLGNALVVPLLGTITLFTVADFIPFMRDLPAPGRLAVAILAGAILVARSPSSAIAIVNELRARGPFTRTVLGVTMITDVAVIFLFAFSTSVADALLTQLGFNLGFIGLLLAELILALLLGYLLGKIGELILSLSIHRLIKIGLTLLIGYGVFAFSAYIRELSHSFFSFEIFLEPLLICMIGSFVVTNYTKYRAEFLGLVHDAGPPIYIAFFTLTGASLELDVLSETWSIALLLFAVRMAGIFIGSFGGGFVARDPLRHNSLSWMTYITMAGVGLGLAKEVVVEFPEWGDAFATMIIAVIVLSQLVGPPFFKWAIHHVGEAHTRATPHEFDGQRDAIIFGLEGQSLALARQLQTHGWEVRIAARSTDYLNRDTVNGGGLDIRSFDQISLEMIYSMGTEKAEAIVTLLSDAENYQICELVYENCGTKDIVVRLNNRTNFDRFHELGALIVDPATAIVSLLDHLVRSPSAASLMLGMEDNQDIIDVEVQNPDMHGVALRDLRFPLDTLILSVYRDGRLLISHGYTQLKIGDRVTIVGSNESLDEVMLRMEA